MSPEALLEKAIFLDRDGVLNHARIIEGKSYPPQTLEDFKLLPGVEKACREFKEAGYKLIVVTNQPDVATGVQTKQVVESMHQKLRADLPIDAIYTCFHVASDNCLCRKPMPGMIEQAAKDHQIDLTQSVMVGDRWRDIEAGQRAGCRCFFIDYGYHEQQPDKPFERVDNLEAVLARVL